MPSRDSVGPILAAKISWPKIALIVSCAHRYRQLALTIAARYGKLGFEREFTLLSQVPDNFRRFPLTLQLPLTFRRAWERPSGNPCNKRVRRIEPC